MMTLREIDLERVKRALPEGVREYLEQSNAMLGGGFIRSVLQREDPSDIDLFITPVMEAYAVVQGLTRGLSRYEKIKTRNATTIMAPEFKIPVQIIHRWAFDTAVELVESFDFTVARAVVWVQYGEWKSICHPDFYADLVGKRLVYCGAAPEVSEPGGSLLRMRKFLNRGYAIDIKSLAEMIVRVVDGDDHLRLRLIQKLQEIDPIVAVGEAELS